MTPAGRLAGALTFLFSIVLIGTLGYALVFGLSWLDALYMTMITVSTVGYRELGDFGTSGRLFTVALILLGVGSFFYTFASLTEFLIEGRVRDVLGRRAMRRQVQDATNHVVLCGYGRFGRVVAEDLSAAGVLLVVVESDPGVVPQLEQAGVAFILGSALEEGVLAEAGLARARALVIATGSDADNVFIALSAREARPDVEIHARANSEAGARRLRLAGAAQVISPYHLGGQRIANAILRPTVVEFMELTSPGQDSDVVIEEVALGPGSPLDGVALGALESRGVVASVVALKRGDGRARISPPASETLRGGDRVIVVGHRDQLRRLAELAEAGGVAITRSG